MVPTNLIQYTKSHVDINPKSITPMGPFPDVEGGFEPDWSKLVAGEVKHSAVLNYEATIPDPE
jgi:putative glutathione S-transferase